MIYQSLHSVEKIIIGEIKEQSISDNDTKKYYTRQIRINIKDTYFEIALFSEKEKSLEIKHEEVV